MTRTLRVVVALAPLCLFACHKSEACRPGTVFLKVTCSAAAPLNAQSVTLHIDESSDASNSKDVDLPITCPGSSGLELVIADYTSNRSFAVSATWAVTPTSGEIGRTSFQLMNGCTTVSLDIGVSKDAGLDAPAVDGAFMSSDTRAPENDVRGPDVTPGTRPSGAHCGLPSDCESLACVDGICCAASCSQTCYSCAGALTTLADGTCGPVVANTARPTDCPTDTAGCGNNGTCDGKGACRQKDASSMCEPAKCSGGHYSAATKCDGLGHCGTASSIDCGAYSCDANNGCKTTCSQDSDCADPTKQYCVSSACVAQPKQLAVGNVHACVLLSDGSVVCWGDNFSGELGDGTFGKARAMPDFTKKAAGVSDFVQISAGNNSTCGVRANGTVACWGANGVGQLGIGTTDPVKLVPTPVVGISDATSVFSSVLGTYTCAIRTAGTVSCWGANDYGQLGYGQIDTAGKSSPVDVLSEDGASKVSGVVQLALGSRHTCALYASDNTACWGDNSLGQLFRATPIQSSIPIQVPVGAASQEAATEDASCVLLKTGGVQCWGSGQFLRIDTTPGGFTTFGSILSLSMADTYTVVRSDNTVLHGESTASAGPLNYNGSPVSNVVEAYSANGYTECVRRASGPQRILCGGSPPIAGATGDLAPITGF